MRSGNPLRENTVWNEVLGLVLGILACGANHESPGYEAAPAGAPAPRVLVNQVGFLPHAAKHVVVEDRFGEAGVFSVVDADHPDRAPVFQGALRRLEGDFGAYHVGQFTSLTVPGRYVIRAGQAGVPPDRGQSYPFRIAGDVYADALDKTVHYFAVQRCGPSSTGYNRPCHLDDGRTEDGRSVDLVGGWHCASDLLKWPSFELAGMYGLLQVASLTADPDMQARIFEEVQWGNLYGLKLQSPEGFLFSYGIGGDPVEQGNHWTDNVRGTADDRPAVLKTGPASLQHQFIAAESLLVKLFRNRDPAYAANCLEAARRCFAWISRQPSGDYLDRGTGIAAGLRLYQATHAPQALDYAVAKAEELLGLQQTENDSQKEGGCGFFFRSKAKEEGVGVSTVEPLALLGLCELAEALPDHPQAPRWRAAIRLHCEGYFRSIGNRNAFGLVPYIAKPRGCRTRSIGGLEYRYFMCPRKHSLWVGNSANAAGAGIVLLKAARLLGQPELAALAQRQLDWILGANPFGLSFVVRVGHANPPEYVFEGFKPRTPFIPGAVMLGIGGDETDQPVLNPGTFHTGEFSISRVYALIWFLAELQRHQPEKKGTGVFSS